MEVPRQCLAIAGKFPPNDYENFLASGAPPSDLPAENCGRMPVIYENGKAIGQSGAVWRYIARRENLMGADNIQAGQIDGLVETIKELNDAYYKLFPYGNTFDDAKKEELRNTFFNHEATGRTDRYAKWFVGFIEQVVGDNGFAVGDNFSLADVVLFQRFGDVATNLGAVGEPFGSLEQTNAFLKNYPKVAKIVANVASNPNIQKWLAMRGDQGF